MFIEKSFSPSAASASMPKDEMYRSAQVIHIGIESKRVPSKSKMAAVIFFIFFRN